MKSDWVLKKISDISRVNENTYSPKENWPFVDYLDTGNITENVIHSLQRINPATEKLPSRARRKVMQNSIIYSTVRPNQRHFGIMKDTSDYLLVSTGFAVIDVNTLLADADFLYFYLSQPDIVEHLHSIAEQSVSAYPSIKASDIEDLEIQLPPLRVQRNISAILRALDNKIALNTQINDNLLQQAEGIFNAWFVDFQAFGGKMPANWSKVPFGSIVRISTETFSPSKHPQVNVEHYSIPAFDEKHFPVFESAAGIKSNKYRLKKHSVMVSKLNPDIKRIWRPYCLSDYPVCSTEFIVYEPFNPAYRDFVFAIVGSENFSKYLCSHTTGSTNSRQRATPSVTLDFEIVYPNDLVIQDFCSIVTPLYTMVENNLFQNQVLAEIRNALLPRLMSGELDVSGVILEVGTGKKSTTYA